VERGFPRLPQVRAAITALYRGLTPEVVRTFDGSVLPVDVAFEEDEELSGGVRRIARVMVRQLRLPDARISVSFRSMPEAAWVALTEGPRYEVELHPRYNNHRRDIGAVLAHEVTHILLHRAGLSLPDTEADEVLTDTAAAYLGVGWLLLDAFRQDSLTSQKLGYLTPEEYGYVLAKRAAVFGEDPRVWFTSPQAYEAYARGLRLAERDEAQPPLAAAGWAARQRYAAQRRLALSTGNGFGQSGPYRFEAPGESGRPDGTPRVVFGCPVCHERLRLPVRGRLRARCGLCRTVLDCDT
jgi:phenylpyruvate tautomerase PptA (4-oxalocrotonate tautomerase family)